MAPPSEASPYNCVGGSRRGCTVIAVAHRPSLAADADLVVMLEAGRIVEQGTHHELLACSPAYRELLQAS